MRRRQTTTTAATASAAVSQGRPNRDGPEQRRAGASRGPRTRQTSASADTVGQVEPRRRHYQQPGRASQPDSTPASRARSRKPAAATPRTASSSAAREKRLPRGTRRKQRASGPTARGRRRRNEVTQVHRGVPHGKRADGDRPTGSAQSDGVTRRDRRRVSATRAAREEYRTRAARSRRSEDEIPIAATQRGAARSQVFDRAERHRVGRPARRARRSARRGWLHTGHTSRAWTDPAPRWAVGHRQRARR